MMNSTDIDSFIYTYIYIYDEHKNFSSYLNSNPMIKSFFTNLREVIRLYTIIKILLLLKLLLLKYSFLTLNSNPIEWISFPIFLTTKDLIFSGATDQYRNPIQKHCGANIFLIFFTRITTRFISIFFISTRNNTNNERSEKNLSLSLSNQTI